MKNILCINGGGVRGIIPLIIIKELNKYRNVLEKIDIVSGSSIGAIICCCLIIPDDKNNNIPKYNIENIIELFKNLIKKIFNISWYNRINPYYGLIKSKYDDQIINDILNDIFGELKVKDLLKEIIIPSYDIKNNNPIIFTTKKHGDILIRDILRSTTAAPTYFNPYEMKIDNIEMKLIDGGVVDNNTSRISLIHELKEYDKKDINILNLGTGYIKIEEINKYGILYWLPNIINILMNGEIKEDIKECEYLLDKRYLLIDILIDKKYFELDNINNMEYYIKKTEESMTKKIINDYINLYN